MIKLTLFGSVPSKKNNKKIMFQRGRVSLRSSDKYLQWHHDQMMTSGIKHIKPIKGPVKHIEITFFIDSKRRTDLSNKAESILDFLVDASVLEDDNCFIVPHLILLFGGVNKENPRAEIVIHSLSNLKSSI